MNENKEIEEMAKSIYESKVALDGTDLAFGLIGDDDHFHRIAIYLYNAGYRNCKDKVVSSKEEFDKLGLVVETVQEYESDEKGQPILVKEQKILKKLQTDFTELLNQEIRELQLAQVCKGMQEENGQLRLENNDLEAENNKLKEEIAKINKLNAENIKLEQQSTARDIIHYVRYSFIHNRREFLKDLEELEKEYGVEL